MVATLLITGLVNTWNLVGSISGLAHTDYGCLLIVKISLFAAMVMVAAINRFRLTPQLDLPGTMRLLQRNSFVEAALGVCIIAIVAALGMMAPHDLIEHIH